MALSPQSESFLRAPLQYVDTGDTKIAYRRFGQGDPLVLLHGWPLSGTTFRHLAPLLQGRFDCYIPDLPGCGQTEWSARTDFGIGGRAKTMSRFLDSLALRRCFLLAQDTGATIGRALALTDGDRIRKFVIINTEIPFHRPPWIPLYRRLLFLPGSNFLFRQTIRSRTFVHSRMGFRECYYDRSLLDGEFQDLVIAPLLESPRLMDGQAAALCGIQWDVVDAMAANHAKLSMPVRLIWGEDDRTFPIALARAMATGFPHIDGLRAIAKAKLLVHEERAEEVAASASEFFLGAAARLAST